MISIQVEGFCGRRTGINDDLKSLIYLYFHLCIRNYMLNQEFPVVEREDEVIASGTCNGDSRGKISTALKPLFLTGEKSLPLQ